MLVRTTRSWISHCRGAWTKVRTSVWSSKAVAARPRPAVVSGVAPHDDEEAGPGARPIERRANRRGVSARCHMTARTMPAAASPGRCQPAGIVATAMSAAQVSNQALARRSHEVLSTDGQASAKAMAKAAWPLGNPPAPYQARWFPTPVACGRASLSTSADTAAPSTAPPSLRPLPEARRARRLGQDIKAIQAAPALARVRAPRTDLAGAASPGAPRRASSALWSSRRPAGTRTRARYRQVKTAVHRRTSRCVALRMGGACGGGAEAVGSTPPCRSA